MLETKWKEYNEKLKEEGKREGLKEGKREGMAAKAREDARKMLEKGFSVNDISDVTGLSKEEVEVLKDERL